MKKNLNDISILNYTLHLIIGEDIPTNIPDKFNVIKLYICDNNNNLSLYADISLPYLINHLEFLNIKGDPRYFFEEGFDPQTQICRYRCEIKPLGKMKGVYRILNGQRSKIMTIKPLCELDNKETNVNFTEKYKNLINTNISKKWLPNPETEYVPTKPDLVKLADQTIENGFVETYCLDESENKQLRLIRNNKNKSHY